MSVTWALRASVPRPSPCKGDALPTELSAQALHVSAPVVKDELSATKKGWGNRALVPPPRAFPIVVALCQGTSCTFDLRRLDQAWRRRQSWQRRLGGLALRFGALEPTHALG